MLYDNENEKGMLKVEAKRFAPMFYYIIISTYYFISLVLNIYLSDYSSLCTRNYSDCIVLYYNTYDTVLLCLYIVSVLGYSFSPLCSSNDSNYTTMIDMLQHFYIIIVSHKLFISTLEF